MSKKTEAIKGVKYLHNNRIDYSKISGTLPLPNLVEIQTNSFNWLVNQGLDEVFKDIFPIKNPSETLVIQTPSLEAITEYCALSSFAYPLACVLASSNNLFEDIDNFASTRKSAD